MRAALVPLLLFCFIFQHNTVLSSFLTIDDNNENEEDALMLQFMLENVVVVHDNNNSNDGHHQQQEQRNLIEYSSNDSNMAMVMKEHLMDLDEYYVKINEKEEEDIIATAERRKDIALPIYFHIPKAGGTTIAHITKNCLKLVTNGMLGYPLVSLDGIQHAIDERFTGTKSREADILETTYPVLTVQSVLDSQNKGLMFTLFRHPIEREFSLFYFLQDADWQDNWHPEWKGWSIQEYVDSGYISHNWVTRQIIGKHHTGEDVNQNDVDIAKEIIRQKFIVGLVSEFDESLKRFRSMFGWFHNNDNEEEEEFCLTNLETNPSNTHSHPHYDKDSHEWSLLEPFFEYDIQLYEYAVNLFHEQGEQYFNGDTIN